MQEPLVILLDPKEVQSRPLLLCVSHGKDSQPFAPSVEHPLMAKITESYEIFEIIRSPSRPKDNVMNKEGSIEG